MDIAWVLCKKSARSLYISWLPYFPCPTAAWNNARGGCGQCWKGQVPQAIKPKKECTKSCESYFANTLSLNDKGPSRKWVCFPKVLWPLSYLTLTLNKPSEFFECYLLLDHYCLTITDEIYVSTLYSYANKSNKSPLRNRLLALLLWEISHLSSPSRSCLGRLILIQGGQVGPEGGAPAQLTSQGCYSD